MAWIAVLLLWPVALLNYLDRQMLASMKFSVMADVSSVETEARWGYMLAQFKWVYAILSPFGGLIADRVSRRYTICASLFVWSAVTLATGHVNTYEELLWTRTLMGFSEAFYIPAALALIADYHPGGTRSRAVSIHQTAIYCGVIVGGFGGYVADEPSLGWRVAFDVTGVLGILYAVPLLFLLRDAPRVKQERSVARSEIVSDIFRLLTNLSFILLVLYFTLPAMAGWVLRDWMPAILKEQFKIEQGPAGVYATLFLNVAALFGAFAGGWLADHLMKRTQRGRIYVSAMGMALLIPALFGVGNPVSITFSIAFLILFGIGWGFFDCNNMPILSQIAQPRLRATGYGIMNLVSISCGGLIDWGFGVLKDKKVPNEYIFNTFAGVAFVSIALVLLIQPRSVVAAEEKST